MRVVKHILCSVYNGFRDQLITMFVYEKNMIIKWIYDANYGPDDIILHDFSEACLCI